MLALAAITIITYRNVFVILEQSSLPKEIRETNIIRREYKIKVEASSL